MTKPKKITGGLRKRKQPVEEDALFRENIRLEMFPYPIPREFLTKIDSRYWKYLKQNEGQCVVYYSSPQNDSIKSGYYEVLRVGDKIVIQTSRFGEYTVEKENCFLTQELLFAYERGIKLIFESVSLEDSSTIIKEIQAERWNEMSINSYELE